MSLFPAYSEEGNDNKAAQVPNQGIKSTTDHLYRLISFLYLIFFHLTEESQEWLSNPSFHAQESKSEKFADSSLSESSPKRVSSRREKKKKSKHLAKKKKKEFDRHFEVA